ncbi:MAG: DivIVA domain-containing protein [Ruminococcaceae bacterium]|nr:DivIVA domain-containing protein [Oscillospiraceae bacterium]MBQ3216102.1 DivIVA domain-containing protein [Oscillospiraceae bacterium]
MFTPQQIEQISFSRATFGGYDMQAVDEFLEPLTEDYVTLYKENALLKSKMRVLVAKLEEYRANEASMKEAIVNAQKTCDTMVKDAESKCTQMLDAANVAAAENAKNTDVLIEAENDRLEEARRVTSSKIQSMEMQIKDLLEMLAEIREENRPADIPAPAVEKKDPDVADEISQNLEALVGRAENTAPTAEPKHPVSDTTTSSKFANLQFGRNYDPLKK